MYTLFREMNWLLYRNTVLFLENFSRGKHISTIRVTSLYVPTLGTRYWLILLKCLNGWLYLNFTQLQNKYKLRFIKSVRQYPIWRRTWLFLWKPLYFMVFVNYKYYSFKTIFIITFLSCLKLFTMCVCQSTLKFPFEKL